MKKLVRFAALAFIATSAAAQHSHPPSAHSHQAASASQGGLHAHTHGAAHIYEAYKALREGGVVIFMRHTKTNVLGKDDVQPAQVSDANCERQRNLSASGKEAAREIAQSWTLLKLPKVDRVEYSPYCRTRETAQLAFGTNGFPISANADLMTTPESMSQLGDRLKKAFSTAPAAGTNRVLVGHVFSALPLGQHLEEGESLLAKPDGQGSYRILGRITATQWGDLTRDVLAYGDRVFELSKSHGHHAHGAAPAAHHAPQTQPAATHKH
jgi:phosphohistidine phosphatase SixA